VGNTLARVTFLVFIFIYFVRRVTFVDDGAALGIIIIITHLIFFFPPRRRAERCNQNVSKRISKLQQIVLSD